MLTVTQLGGSMVAVGLNLLFGLAYAATIHDFNKRGWLEGYTALSVIFGTLITLLINQFFVYVPDDAALDFCFELAGFAASGTPMTLNNIYEYLIRKQESIDFELEEAGRD